MFFMRSASVEEKLVQTTVGALNRSVLTLVPREIMSAVCQNMLMLQKIERAEWNAWDKIEGCSCCYRGQPIIMDNRQEYIHDPGLWFVEPGAWKSRTKLAFEWQRWSVEGWGAQATSIVQTTYHDMLRQGVPAPCGWRTLARAVAAPRLRKRPLPID